MKIVFVTQNEGPFRMKWLDELAKYAEVVVFHVGEYDKNVNKKFISYKTCRAVSKDISKVVLKRRLFKIQELMKESCDLMILDGYGFLAQQILICCLKIKKKKYMMSIDGGFINQSEGRIKREVKSFFISGAIAYLSTSADTDKFICHYVGDDAQIIRHLFSSVLMKEIRKNIESSEQINIRRKLKIKNSFTVIAVGQFIYRKGFDILIDALQYMKCDVQIYFVGASNTSLYEEYINELNESKLHFVDFCDEELLGEYYRSADVFVLPTRSDVWGLVIGEAMSYGLPVVTTEQCLAGKAMIQDGINGYIVGVEDAVALAEKLQFLYENPDLRKKMGANNVELIKKYSIEESTKNDINNLRKIGCWNE